MCLTMKSVHTKTWCILVSTAVAESLADMALMISPSSKFTPVTCWEAVHCITHTAMQSYSTLIIIRSTSGMVEDQEMCIARARNSARAWTIHRLALWLGLRLGLGLALFIELVLALFIELVLNTYTISPMYLFLSPSTSLIYLFLSPSTSPTYSLALALVLYTYSLALALALCTYSLALALVLYTYSLALALALLIP